MSLPTDQFEILANSLRIFPERIYQLDYFINDANDPEEGIANIEVAFRDVLNQIYGMMGCLKDSGIINTLYEYPSITSLLCLRHPLQHNSGKVRNLFRDIILNRLPIVPVQIEYSASDYDRGRCPFPISITWYETSVRNSNYSKKWSEISNYLNLEILKHQAKAEHLDWDHVYIDATSLITEAASNLCKTFKEHFSPSGYDSEVYCDHFCKVASLDMQDAKLKQLDSCSP